VRAPAETTGDWASNGGYASSLEPKRRARGPSGALLCGSARLSAGSETVAGMSRGVADDDGRKTVTFGSDDQIEVVVQTDDGRWHFGTLATWTKEIDRWVGWVRYSVDAIGRSGTFDQDRIIRLEYCPLPWPRRPGPPESCHHGARCCGAPRLHGTS